jgi:hypothetical protein
MLYWSLTQLLIFSDFSYLVIRLQMERIGIGMNPRIFHAIEARKALESLPINLSEQA